MNHTQQLHDIGQSLWLDSISRTMLTTGTLARYRDQYSVTGLTSNPTILGHAMAAGSGYDGSLRAQLDAGVTDPQQIVYAAALEDLTAAADLFRPVYDATGGIDGYVSLEVPPGLAYDATATIDMARKLHTQADRPNLLVKIPGTPAGLTALEQCIVDGIGINVTLLFSETHYLQTAETYLRALERRRAAHEPLNVPSVASIFVSRWDKAADAMLPVDMHAKLGIAVSQKVYAAYRAMLDSDRWKALADAGATPQRLLWASTSTKDPTFPDTYYLTALAAPDTIDTIPEKTLLAFADHGTVTSPLAPDIVAADEHITAVADHGIDVDELAQSLQRQGARRFEADWATLLESISNKTDKLAA